MPRTLRRPRTYVKAAAAVALSFFMSGCATIFYNKTPTGQFQGKLDVEWIAPNRFIYRPNSTDPLIYTTKDGLRVEPRLMYTDGGSIPRLFWSAPLLGPWDFAPGYIVHDWLFRQHHCKEEGWEKVDFPRSAEILAEAIKTQMVKSGNQDATVVWAIYEAVKTPVAQSLWDRMECTPVPAPLPNASPQGVKILSISFPR